MDVRPDGFHQLLLAQDAAGIPGEQPQYLQGLGPELDRLAIGPAQLGALGIELKTRKAQHRSPPSRQLSPFSPRIDRKIVPKRTGAPNIRKISECLNSRFRTSLPPGAMLPMPQRPGTGEFRVRSKVSAQNPASRGGMAVLRTRAVLFASVALAALAISPAAQAIDGFENIGAGYFSPSASILGISGDDRVVFGNGFVGYSLGWTYANGAYAWVPLALGHRPDGGRRWQGRKHQRHADRCAILRHRARPFVRGGLGGGRRRRSPAGMEQRRGHRVCHCIDHTKPDHDLRLTPRRRAGILRGGFVRNVW